MPSKKKAASPRAVKTSPAKAAKVVKAAHGLPRSEPAVFLGTLEAHGQVTRDPGPLAAGVTHRLESDGKGGERLKRARFSAI